MARYTRNYIDFRAVGHLEPELVKEKRHALVGAGKTPAVVHDWVLYFPTPKDERTIAATRRELAKFAGDELILDLRGNVGGDPFIFYDALRPILPQSGVLLQGGRKNGEVLFNSTVEGDEMTINYGDKYIRTASLTPSTRMHPKLAVRVNEKSQSASQMIALILMREGAKLIGDADKDLTNICINWGYQDTQIPAYRFLDKAGNPIEGLANKATWSTGTPRFGTPMEKTFLEHSVVQKDMPKIDEPPYICYEHEFAALRFRYSPGNRHIRTFYDLRNHPPRFKDGVVFIPDFKEGTLEEIEVVYEPIWKQMRSWKGRLIVDCRGFSVEGPRARAVFEPMLSMASRITLIVDEFVAAYSEHTILEIVKYFDKHGKVIGRRVKETAPKKLSVKNGIELLA